GGGFTSLAALVTGDDPQPVTAWLFAIILVAPTAALFWIAMGLGAVSLPRLPARAIAAGRRKEAAAPDDAERNGLFDVAIGGMVHLGFTAQAALRRAVTKARDRAAARREAEAQPWRDGAVEPSMAGGVPAVEPVWREPRPE